MFRSNEGRGKKDLLFSLCIVGILLLSVSCEGSFIGPNEDPIPDRVLILAATDVVVTGDTARFRAIVYDRNGKEIADAPITWATTRPSVASIDATGLLTGWARGKVNVLATVSGSPLSADMYGMSADMHGDVSAAPPPGKGNQGGNGSKPIKVRDAGSLVIQPVEVNLAALEETIQLEAGLVGSSGTDSSLDVKWRSLDRTVATVDDTGLAVAVTPGTARVIATANCCDADTVEVMVDPRVASIVIASSPSSLQAGTTVQLEATSRDKNGHEVANADLAWSTSTASVASIDQDANLTANAAGTAKITASADDATTGFSVSVVDAAGGVEGPPGMTVIGSADGSVLGGIAGTATAGEPGFGIPGFNSWWEFSCSNESHWPDQRIQLVDDRTNPSGSGKAIRISVSAEGCGAISTANPISGSPYSELYIKFSLHPEIERTGNIKLFYLATETLSGVSGDAYFSLMSHGGFYLTVSGAQYKLRDILPVGEWNTVEVHAVAESAAEAGDGEYHVWVNGRHAATWTGIRWAARATGDDSPLFDKLQWYGHHSNRGYPVIYRIGEFSIAGR
jgi:hypothetical protein